jgi:hypothetical protein
MKKNAHVEIMNPAVLLSPRPAVAALEGCAVRQDAPVCTNGATDVTCQTEIYRGCATGQTDCADNTGNPDDRCCSGSSAGGVGDNIDHAYCREADADFGGFSYCFWGFDGHTPYYY